MTGAVIFESSIFSTAWERHGRRQCRPFCSLIFSVPSSWLHRPVQKPLAASIRTSTLEARPTIFALDDSLVTVFVTAIAHHRRFCAAGDARSQCILGNRPTETSVKNEIRAFKQWFFFRGLFLQGPVVRNDSACQSRNVRKT